MDDDLILAQFGEIEEKVERLIGVCRSQQRQHIELETKIKSLEEDLRRKTEAQTKYAEEKALVRSKLDGLLAKLDELLQA